MLNKHDKHYKAIKKDKAEIKNLEIANAKANGEEFKVENAN